MKSATASGVTSTYKYNQDGLRTSKTVGGSETKYYLNNGVMIAEQNTAAGRAIAYLMDENNNKSGFIYNGAYYYYVFNVQGDVMGIINNSGTMMAKYTYDAWGKVLSVTDGNGVVQTSSSFIGNINPIRYRGYYYDTETGLYYLQSRYYDPETGRFVNADGYVQTGTGSVFDKNMYAYCENNPVNFSDPTGTCAHTSFPGRCDICGEFNSSYMQDKSIIEEAAAVAITAAGAVKGSNNQHYKLTKGWEVRVDKQTDFSKEHIHVFKKGVKYSQNIDGSPHDGSKGDPPAGVKRELKEKIAWDWDAKAKSWNNHQSCMFHFANCGYETGECTCESGVLGTNPNYSPIPGSKGSIPSVKVPSYSFSPRFSFGY